MYSRLTDDRKVSLPMNGQSYCCFILYTVLIRKLNIIVFFDNYKSFDQQIKVRLIVFILMAIKLIEISQPESIYILVSV